MLRMIDYVLLGFALIAAIGVYHVKHDAEVMMKYKKSTEQALQQELDALSLLKAEWSVLNKPERLQKLAERYFDDLQLEPMRPDALTRLDALPMRIQPLDPVQPQKEDGFAAHLVLHGGEVY